MLRPGLVLAIVPMLAQKLTRVLIADDGWPATTENGSLAAHFEHTVAITESGPWVLTAGSNDGKPRVAERGVHGA